MFVRGFGWAYKRRGGAYIRGKAYKKYKKIVSEWTDNK